MVNGGPGPLRAEVLLEDHHHLAVAKPAGVSVLADRAGAPCLLEQLRRDFAPRGETCFTVHRLDKGTSGVILFAKTEDSLRELVRQFEERLVQKRYLALVRGVPREREGTIDLPLLADARGPLRVRVDAGGKNSQTEYRVIETFRDFSLIEARPRTGRTHQIRVHLHAIGCPLAVDSQYGGAEALFLSAIKSGYRPPRGRPERPLIERLSLHAASIRYLHPATGEETSVEAPLPDDFALALKQLRKYGR